MKKFSLGIAALLTLCITSVSQASFVIDDFQTGTGLMSNGVNNVVNNPNATGVITPSGFDRTVTLGGTFTNNGGQPNIQGSIAGGTAGFAFQSVNTTLDVLYNNFGMNVLNTLGSTISTTLQHSGAARDYLITVYGNSSSGAVSASQVVTLGNTPTVFNFDTALWGNANAAKNLTSVGFTVQRISGSTTNNSNVQFKAIGGITTTGNLVPVPEPASMVLLGLTGLAGVVYRRRRSSEVVA